MTNSKRIGLILIPLLTTVTFLTLMPLGAHAAIGEIGLQFSTERTEDQGVGSSSERHFRFNIASGFKSALNNPESADAVVNADGSTTLPAAGKLVHWLGYGIAFRGERGLLASSEVSGFGLGVFVAWYAGPFSIRADYIALAEMKSNSSITETAFREGSGFAVSARWLHALENQNISIGPSLSFEQMTYAKSQIGSLPESSNSRKTESLIPGVVAVFHF